MKENFEDYVCSICASMIENGAEISRAEDSAKRMLKSNNITDFSVFCLSSLVIIRTKSTVSIKRVYCSDLNLYEINRLNNLSRSVCNKSSFSEEKNSYNIVIKILSIMLATGSFCLYFGGSIVDAIFSGIIGIFISFIPKISNTIFPRTFGQSLIAGVLAFVPNLIGINTNPSMIMIGTIMLLIPGITIGTAIRDVMYSDTISGIVELCESLFLALAISLGYAFGVIIFGD